MFMNEVYDFFSFGPHRSSCDHLNSRCDSPLKLSIIGSWLARKIHMMKPSTVTFHSHNFRVVSSFILHGVLPPWVSCNLFIHCSPARLIVHQHLTWWYQWIVRHPGDLKWRERTGTSCQIKIHLSIEITQYLLKYTLFRFQIYFRGIVLVTENIHKISTSFMKNNKRYNWLNTAKWISISTTLLNADWLKCKREITWITSARRFTSFRVQFSSKDENPDWLLHLYHSCQRRSHEKQHSHPMNDKYYFSSKHDPNSVLSVSIHVWNISISLQNWVRLYQEILALHQFFL